ncbi:M48 family metallopeptidase, partial [Singulisphaera rosea]
MDYFQNQDAARKKTGILIAYFVLAVVAIVVSIYLSVATITHFAKSGHPSSVLGLSWLWDPGLFGLVAIGTSALVAGGSLYRIASLAGGGHTVA